MMKIVIAAGATLALVTAAGAADIPRPQPVYQTGPDRQDADWQDPNREDPGRQDARRGAALCAVLTRIHVDSDLYRRQLKGEPWQTGRSDQDYACLRDSLSCSSA